MSKGLFALQPGEAVVWQERPHYRKWGLPFTIFVTVELVVISFVVPPGPSGLLQNLGGVVFVFGLLNLIWVYVFTKYAGVSYYVTDRRVARVQDLRIFKTIREFPFSSILRILTKRWRGRNIIVFQLRDASTLTFVNFSADPDKIRQTIEKMIEAGRQSALQEF